MFNGAYRVNTRGKRHGIILVALIFLDPSCQIYDVIECPGPANIRKTNYSRRSVTLDFSPGFQVMYIVVMLIHNCVDEEFILSIGGARA